MILCNQHKICVDPKMKLISIENESHSLHKNTAIIGIDLGTTHSVVAKSKQNKVQILPIGGIDQSNDLIPTILKNTDNNFALTRFINQNCIDGFKRFMEKPDTPIIEQYTPVDLSAIVLRELKERSEKWLNKTIAGAVITVPAHFSNIARKATKDAAKKANLNVIRLLNEPTAAALAYGLQNKPSNGIYLVYDFGGGTFDVTILRIENGVFQILATTGDLYLGGRDIDYAFLKASDIEDPTAEQRCLAQSIKEKGWTPHNALHISQSDFQQITSEYFDRTAQIVRKTLGNLEFTPDQIDNVILVGGSTKLDAVYQGLSQIFGSKKILRDIDPDRAVAIGAALHSEIISDLTHDSARPLLLDVIPSSLGIETAMGVVENIIPKYTPTPIQVQTQFSTFYNNQTDILIHIVQGDHVLASECTSLGRFILKGINPMPGGKPKILVTFNIDDDGILKVSAHEEISGIQNSLTLESYCK